MYASGEIELLLCSTPQQAAQQVISLAEAYVLVLYILFSDKLSLYSRSIS